MLYSRASGIQEKIMLKDLVLKCRSYRRFDQKANVDLTTLRELADMARCTASATNRQPLKYILCASKEKNAQVFSCLHWAALLKSWGGPKEGERPSAYIVMLGDKEVAPTFGVDPGIAAWTILLGAVEKGLGGCMLMNVDRDPLRQYLNIPARFDIPLVIAIGKPAETVIIDDLSPGESPNYFRDNADNHHVPKRRLKDIIVAEL
jgi:nitroreductase